jgi:hypothetical protein
MPFACQDYQVSADYLKSGVIFPRSTIRIDAALLALRLASGSGTTEQRFCVPCLEALGRNVL